MRTAAPSQCQRVRRRVTRTQSAKGSRISLAAASAPLEVVALARLEAVASAITEDAASLRTEGAASAAMTRAASRVEPVVAVAPRAREVEAWEAWSGGQACLCMRGPRGINEIRVEARAELGPPLLCFTVSSVHYLVAL